MESTTITIKLPEELRAAFKMAALKQKKTMTDILIACIKRQVKKDQKEKS